MSKWGITAVLLTGFFLGTLGAARSQSIDNFGNLILDGASVYGSVGGVILQRSNPGGGPIVGAFPTGAPAFVSGSDYKFERDTGFDGTIGVRFLRYEAVEVRVLNFGTTNAESNVTTPGNFIGAGFTGPGGILISSQYDTTLRSWEVDWRHQLFDHLTVLAGLRSINVTDDLGFAIGPTAAAQYNYDNQLRGAQIGADLAILPQSSPFQIDVIGKIGKYTLHSGGGIEQIVGGSPVGSFQTSISDGVYASEAAISAGYRMSDHILIRAGYQVLRISNIGLASNNASASLVNPGLLSANVYRGNLYFRGVNFGAVISW